ncbi:MAG: lyase [Xanthobacteraceae bacterium]|jgi:virginiamycin B lyase
MIRSIAMTLAALAAGIAAAPAAEAIRYDLPPGSYPHDVAPAADGTVWYSDQRQGFLGRFDPETGKAEQIPLGRDAAPHGVTIGGDGGVWLADGGQNAIVRYDPATRAVRVFPLPKAFAAANLNTAVFAGNAQGSGQIGGQVWFTGQSGMYGRVDPASGKVEVWRSPKGVGPYGIATTPAGDVWYASLAGDYIARIDPATGAATVVPPPRPGVGPRRIWSDSRGLLWVSLWNSGEVGRYDPIAKAWRTWRLPHSGSGCYAVYVDDKDRVWLTDFVANAVVRFDPQTETFQSFPSDRGGANVRQLAGRPGEVWGGESGTARLVVVRD